MVPRGDLIRACLGFDMLVAARTVAGDTLAVDQATGDAVVIGEQTFTEADWACGSLESVDGI
jgi:hypothetical protein